MFGPQSTQQDVFGEISQLIQCVLDGYRVCIFAYGQTGSGKTYTMEGPSGTMDEDSIISDGQTGMIPRAILQIFATSEAMRAKGWCFSLEASFLEIYNETIRDLLSFGGENSKKLDIKHNPTTGRTHVPDLSICRNAR